MRPEKTTGFPKAAVSIVEQVSALRPVLRARAGEEEQARRLSDATIADIRGAQLQLMHVPLQYGGFELGMREHFEVARLLAHCSASVAWVTSFLMMNALSVRKFSPEVQRRVFDDPGYMGVCGSNQPEPGTKAVAVDGGYLLTGRWHFVSGVHHASWAALAALLETAVTDGPPQRIFVIVRTADLTIDDNWHTAGMRATGSNDVTLENFFVPHDQGLNLDLFSSDQAPGVLADPENELNRCPIFRKVTVTHPAYPLGVAERCLEYFATEVAPSRQRYWGGGPLKDSPNMQLRYAEAALDTRIAGLLADDVVNGTIAGLRSGYSLEERAYLTLQSAASIEYAAKAVQTLARRAGGHMHFTGGELDRHLRDISVLINHSTADLDYAKESSGRALLGQGLGTRPEAFF